MGGLLSGLAVLGLAAAATPPLGLMAVFVVLGGKRPTANGLAFLAGWFTVLLAIVLAAAFLFNGEVKPKTAPSTAMLWLTLALGVGCIAWAIRMRRRPRTPPLSPRAPTAQRSDLSSARGVVLDAAGPRRVPRRQGQHPTSQELTLVVAARFCINILSP